MPKGFWGTIKKPVVAIAPMAGVTDFVFRTMLSKYGKPDVMWTEFVSADGLCSERGREKLLPDLWYKKKEQPIVAQLFSSSPEKMYMATKLIVSLGFDGVDINMGCPDRAVERQGAGASLIKNPTKAREIICAVKDAAGKIPVSVKTRIGYNKNEIDSWIPIIAQMGPDAITVHGRTRKEMSKVPARWEDIAYSANIIKALHSKKTCPVILGNGDVKTRSEAVEKCRQYGIDGVMIGRGIFSNIFAFRKREKEFTKEVRIAILIEHARLFEKTYMCGTKDSIKSYDTMRKFYKMYIEGFRGAKELRVKLMETNSREEAELVLKQSLEV